MNRYGAGSVLAALLLLAACQPPDRGQAAQSTPATDGAPTTTAPTAAAPTATAPTATAPTATASAPAKPDRALFADRVWRVTESRSVEAGTTYAFLADGTLVIDSPNGTPLYGQWRFENDALTLVEEGLTYPTDILGFDGTALRLRSNNPGEPVELVLVAAPDVPLPPAKPR